MNRAEHKATKRKRAMARQAERDQRTPEQQLDRLDDLFGLNQGAARERARLEAQIANRHQASKTHRNRP